MVVVVVIIIIIIIIIIAVVVFIIIIIIINCNAERIYSKYAPLISDLKRRCKSDTFVNLYISSLGISSNSCLSFLEKCNNLSIDEQHKRYFMDKSWATALLTINPIQKHLKKIQVFSLQVITIVIYFYSVTQASQLQITFVIVRFVIVV